MCDRSEGIYIYKYIYIYIIYIYIHNSPKYVIGVRDYIYIYIYILTNKVIKLGLGHPWTPMGPGRRPADGSCGIPRGQGQST